MRLTRTAAVLDIASVVIFVVIGRASHVKGESLAGIASTSWPFLAGLAAGWVLSLSLARRRRDAQDWPAAVRPAGVVVWLCTVAAGMVLRVVAGQGTAAAFIVVALVFLGLFLLGWRAAAAVAARSRFGTRLKRTPSSNSLLPVADGPMTHWSRDDKREFAGELSRPAWLLGLPASKPSLTLAISASS